MEPLGEWDSFITEALSTEPLLEAASYSWLLAVVELNHLEVLVRRGQASGAGKLAAWVNEKVRTESGHIVAALSAVSAAERMAVGDGAAALDLLAVSEAAFRVQGGFWWAACLPLAVRTALAAGDRRLAERLASAVEPPQPLCRHARAAAEALVVEARGEHEAAAEGFADAAARWHDFCVPYEEAQALLGRGRCLVALGRAPEAAVLLAAAREIFARLGAKPVLAETDELMQKVSSA